MYLCAIADAERAQVNNRIRAADAVQSRRVLSSLFNTKRVETTNIYNCIEAVIMAGERADIGLLEPAFCSPFGCARFMACVAISTPSTG